VREQERDNLGVRILDTRIVVPPNNRARAPSDVRASSYQARSDEETRTGATTVDANDFDRAGLDQRFDRVVRGYSERS
jgi:hypothetical protein